MPCAITQPNTGSQESRMHYFRLNKADLARWYLWQVTPNYRLPRLKPDRFYIFQLRLPRLQVAVLGDPTADCVVDQLLARHDSPLFAQQSIRPASAVFL